MTDDVLTAREAAALLRLCKDSLYAAANRGDIPHRRVGRRLLFSKVALMSWLRQEAGTGELPGGILRFSG